MAASPGPHRPQEDLVSQGFLESVLSDCVVPGILAAWRREAAVGSGGGQPGWELPCRQAGTPAALLHRGRGGGGLLWISLIVARTRLRE